MIKTNWSGLPVNLLSAMDRSSAIGWYAIFSSASLCDVTRCNHRTITRFFASVRRLRSKNKNIEKNRSEQAASKDWVGCWNQVNVTKHCSREFQDCSVNRLKVARNAVSLRGINVRYLLFLDRPSWYFFLRWIAKRFIGLFSFYKFTSRILMFELIQWRALEWVRYISFRANTALGFAIWVSRVHVWNGFYMNKYHLGF